MDSPAPLPDVSWSQTRFAGNGLRTRFRPTRRIRTYLLVFFPWVDILILTLCLGYAVSKKAVTPGVQATLPSTPFPDAIHANLLFVVAPPAPSASSPLVGPLVFFNSHRYDIGVQANDFRSSIHAYLQQAALPETNAVLFVDGALTFDKLSDLLLLLRESGIQHIHFATKSK